MKNQSSNTPLIPLSDFQEVAKKIFSVSKEESDEQMKQFQTENPKSKAEKSKGKKTA